MGVHASDTKNSGMRCCLAEPCHSHRLLHRIKRAILRPAAGLDTVLLPSNPGVPQGEFRIPPADDQVLIAQCTSGRPHEANTTKRESPARAHARRCRVLRYDAAVHRVSSFNRLRGHVALSLHAHAVFREHHQRSRELLGESFNIHYRQPRVSTFVHAFLGIKKTPRSGCQWKLATVDAFTKDERNFYHFKSQEKRLRRRELLVESPPHWVEIRGRLYER